MFEWFLYIFFVFGFWFIYEIVKDKVCGFGCYWIIFNVEGDVECVEYFIK